MVFEDGNAVALLALAALPSFVSVHIVRKTSLGKSQGGLKDLRARSRKMGTLTGTTTERTKAVPSKLTSQP